MKREIEETTDLECSETVSLRVWGQMCLARGADVVAYCDFLIWYHHIIISSSSYIIIIIIIIIHTSGPAGRHRS